MNLIGIGTQCNLRAIALPRDEYATEPIAVVPVYSTSRDEEALLISFDDAISNRITARTEINRGVRHTFSASTWSYVEQENAISVADGEAAQFGLQRKIITICLIGIIFLAGFDITGFLLLFAHL